MGAVGVGDGVLVAVAVGVSVCVAVTVGVDVAVAIGNGVMVGGWLFVGIGVFVTALVARDGCWRLVVDDETS